MKSKFWAVEDIRQIVFMILQMSDREIQGTPRSMLVQLLSTNFTREQAWGVFVAISSGKNENLCSRLVLETLNVEQYYNDPLMEQ